MTSSFSHGYALLIGVGKSAYPAWSLPAATRDMQALRALLTDSTRCGYPSDDGHIRLLHDEGATKQAILAGLEWLHEQTRADEDATAVVYFSGHGWLNKATDRFYLIPHDIQPFNISGSAVSGSDFTSALRQVAARRLLVFIDCCHSAGMATSKDEPPLQIPPEFSQSALPKGLNAELKQGKGRAVFSSSTGEQKSWVRPDQSLSIYTYHLLEALQGAANQPGDKAVRVSHLMGHVAKTVPASAQQFYQAEQTPFFDTATEDFPVALLLAGKGLSKDGWDRVQAESQQAKVIQTGEHNIYIERAVATVIGENNKIYQSFGPDNDDDDE